MKDFMLLMHNDIADDLESNNAEAWNRYLQMLKNSGQFSGGSSMGAGVCVNKSGSSRPIAAHLSGYIRIQAQSIEDAKRYVIGNPVFESGGTVEIRELPKE